MASYFERTGCPHGGGIPAAEVRSSCYLNCVRDVEQSRYQLVLWATRASINLATSRWEAPDASPSILLLRAACLAAAPSHGGYLVEGDLGDPGTWYPGIPGIHVYLVCTSARGRCGSFLIPAPGPLVS